MSEYAVSVGGRTIILPYRIVSYRRAWLSFWLPGFLTGICTALIVVALVAGR